MTSGTMAAVESLATIEVRSDYESMGNGRLVVKTAKLGDPVVDLLGL